MKRVAEVMTPEVRMLEAQRLAREAPRLLREHDIGRVPVARDDRLIGGVSDRDIVMRVMAENRDPRDPALVGLDSVHRAPPPTEGRVSGPATPAPGGVPAHQPGPEVPAREHPLPSPQEVPAEPPEVPVEVPQTPGPAAV